jgi:SiaC family regulatory phosphoprotein
MEVLSIEATAQTPSISFNPLIGRMEINGRSIPDTPDEFWMPVLNWFESYLISPSPKTTFKINLEYFNISSSKRILFLLYKLNELSERGLDVCVEWHYRTEDEDMYEVGQDYAYMVKVPFEFKEYRESDLMIA